jgi:UrcA family protein
MTMNTKIRTAAYCLWTAAAFLGVQASAATVEDSPPTKRVSYADLDVSTAAGAQVLYRRIVAAAHQVCESPGTRDLSMLQMERQCDNQAIDNAVKSVHSPALSQLRSAKVIHLASN